MTIPGYDDWRLRGPDDDRCPDCDGSGEHDCLNCGGDGEVSNGLECPCCDGTGLVDCETCRRDEPDGDYLYERARDRRMEKETW